MNEAERLLRKLYGLSVAQPAAATPAPLASLVHPKAEFSLFGPSGGKEHISGRDAFIEFVSRCYDATAGHRNEILDIVGLDEQCAFVRAHAWRKAKGSGEEIAYDWAMLYRVEDGLITYGADMLDARAQAFWGRVL